MAKIKSILMNKIGFLNWGLVDHNYIKASLGFPDFTQGDLFISPDVKSFHLVTVEYERVPQSNRYFWTWCHEIVDYPDYETLFEALENEVFDDAWDSGEIDKYDDIFRLLSTHRDVTIADLVFLSAEWLRSVDGHDI